MQQCTPAHTVLSNQQLRFLPEPQALISYTDLYSMTCSISSAGKGTMFTAREALITFGVAANTAILTSEHNK